MVPTMKLALTVTIIASFACSAFALRCYNCDSTRDSKCGENFESQDNFKIDCSVLAPQRSQSFGLFGSRNATGCMKRLFDYAPGHPRIERTCYFGDVNNKGAGCVPELSQINQRVLSCDVCTDNLCNGSSSIAPVGIAILLFFALARFFA